MAKIMKSITALSFVLTLVFAAVHIKLHIGWALPVAITAGTTFYHFAMRLTVGAVFDKTMHNKADYNRKRYRVGRAEKRLYEALKVKRWKKYMPSYQPDLFTPEKHTWDEIAQAMCQAELVHETIAVLSFVPILASGIFGDLFIFVITSLAAALFDLIFVIMQRYNRPRVVRLAERERYHNENI